MKHPLSFVLTASLLLLPLVSALGQGQANEPVSFAPPDPAAPAQEVNKTPEQPDAQQLKSAPAVSGIFAPHGTVITPAISVSRPGKGVHTNFKIFVPDGHQISSAIPQYTFAERPSTLGCVYNVGPTFSGCKASVGGTDHPSGGWGAIALVDAYDDPRAASDLAVFDANWGLASSKLQRGLCQFELRRS